MGNKSKGSESKNSTRNYDYSLGNADYSTGDGGKTTVQLVGSGRNNITLTDQGAVDAAMSLARETVATIGNGAEQVVNGAYDAIAKNQQTAFDTITGLTQKENNDFKELIAYLVGGAVLIAFALRANK